VRISIIFLWIIFSAQGFAGKILSSKNNQSTVSLPLPDFSYECENAILPDMSKVIPEAVRAVVHGDSPLYLKPMRIVLEKKFHDIWLQNNIATLEQELAFFFTFASFDAFSTERNNVYGSAARVCIHDIGFKIRKNLNYNEIDTDFQNNIKYIRTNFSDNMLHDLWAISKGLCFSKRCHPQGYDLGDHVSWKITYKDTKKAAKILLDYNPTQNDIVKIIHYIAEFNALVALIANAENILPKVYIYALSTILELCEYDPTFSCVSYISLYNTFSKNSQDVLSLLPGMCFLFSSYERAKILLLGASTEDSVLHGIPRELLWVIYIFTIK
jgi:hypothetical protein